MNMQFSLLALGSLLLLCSAGSLQQKTGDASHICCNVPNGPETVPVNTTTVTVKPTSFISLQYVPCGDNSTSSEQQNCPQYGISFIDVIEYHVETSYYTLPSECPAKEITCCPGFVMIRQQCLPINWVAQNTALVITLMQG